MAHLFEEINSVRKLAPDSYKELPDFVSANMNPSFELRPYQIDAFRNFITYFEGASVRKPTQVLFHMATGSGKTLIMAGLILYLYKRGYRNFLFFVNLDNIVQKTKDNFLNATSAKFLFADEISIDGESIRINEVSNFQGANSDSINICFATTQGLHMDIWNQKENAPTFDDFSESKTVLIADEAHHLNVDTRRGKLNKEQEAATNSWEYTVKRIFEANRDNILLEFTATCDLRNPFIENEYRNKIIFNYPLKKFREEKYSKQVKAIRADISYDDRMLQALLFSQYRMKIFADNRRFVKPVVLFKAKTIEDSKKFVLAFHDMVSGLTGRKVEQIFSSSPLEEVRRMDDHFSSKNISYDDLAQELRDEFSPERCISANDDKEATERQLILNSLESPDNPYRAVFAVKKLDEGWDVLNLFDIVRLYETRDAKNGKPGASTIAEAQLIGRGARYFPFVIDVDDEKYKRKYDNDIDNPLRVCEELYYHCQYDSRYIAELNAALIATGIMPESQKEVHYIIKEDFRRGHFYNNGIVFFNSRRLVSRKNVNEILPSVCNKEYSFTTRTGKTAIDTMMTDSITDTTVKTFKHPRTIGEIAALNYSLVHRATRKIDVFKFNVLRGYFPNLNSLREFVTNESYLGGINIAIESREDSLTMDDLYEACFFVMSKIAEDISAINETWEGETTFNDKPFRDIFRSKTRHIAEPQGEGEGISQNDPAVRPEWRLNLGDVDWFMFEDDYGTSEEKAFIAYFASHVDELKKTYDKVYLVRNERQLVLYSFDGGKRFEPDYLLFLQKQSVTGYEQYQIFVEPKGNHLLSADKWKEDFLLQIEGRGIPTKKFVDDNEYRIWGFPFYNMDNRMSEFTSAFDVLKMGGATHDA